MTLPENQIVQGDSVQILKAFPSKSVDLIVTDPPYLVNYRDRSGRTVKNDNGGSAGVLAAFSDAYRVLKPHRFGRVRAKNMLLALSALSASGTALGRVAGIAGEGQAA